MRARTGGAVNKLASAARNRGWRSISSRLGLPSVHGGPGPSADALRLGTTSTVWANVGAHTYAVNGIVVLVSRSSWASVPGLHRHISTRPLRTAYRTACARSQMSSFSYMLLT